MGIQLGFFEAFTDLLKLKPIFLLGFILVGASLLMLFRKSNGLPKIKITICSFLMYYYLCLFLNNIVGIPTLHEFFRLSRLGEAFFNPNINIIPLSDGLSLSFLLNICLFIPLGFLCPMISKTYEHAKNTILLGFGLSLIVEISQLFTLYRATDINDLLSNVLGTLVGFICFKLIAKIKLVKLYSEQDISSNDNILKFLPIIILLLAFVITFIN